LRAQLGGRQGLRAEQGQHAAGEGVNGDAVHFFSWVGGQPLAVCLYL
jgi:hypothetical protein